MSNDLSQLLQEKVAKKKAQKSLSQATNLNLLSKSPTKIPNENDHETVPLQEYMQLMKKYNELNSSFIQMKNIASARDLSISVDSPNGKGLRTEIKDLRDKSASDSKAIVLLRRKLHYYESHTSIRLPRDLESTQELNGSYVFEDRDSRNTPTKGDWEAEKEKLIQRHQEETKGYQNKITQLLGQLRREQQRNKEENMAIRSAVNRSFARDDEVNTAIYYSKEMVDDLKKEIEVLNTKLNTFGSEAGDVVLDEKSIQYALLEKKFQEALRKIELYEKKDNVLGSFRPEYDPQTIGYEQEIDSLREKLRYYENHEIPKLQELNTNLERKLRETERRSVITDTLEDEKTFLERRLRELENEDQENKGKLLEATLVIQSIQKEADEKVQKIKQTCITKVKQVKETMHHLREEFHHVMKNTLFLNQMFFSGLDKIIGDSIQEYLEGLNSEAYNLKTKYIRELRERKKLYNYLQELKGNIRVFCRVRPPNTNEKENMLKFPSEYEISIKDPSTETIKTFEFDHVFPMYSAQSDVFREIKPLITSVLDGYNACIFAYGQTGSGKTYTMEGPVQDRGVYHRAIEDLFRMIKERSQHYEYTVQICLMEIYNEQLRDLFGESGKKVEMKQGPSGLYVHDLSWINVDTYQEVHSFLEKGAKNRAVASTNLNEHSSRSHLIYTIKVTGKNLIEQQTFTSKLNLIDLAGSERLSKSRAIGELQKESIFINKSLSAFGDVIAARLNKNSHIPFRNSLLTFVLQDSLSGDSKVLMILQVSPALNSADESINSLKFGARVHNVELGPANSKQNSLKKK